MTLKKKDNNFVFYLNNEDAEDDDQFNICAKYLFYVRNYKNYSNYEYKCNYHSQNIEIIKKKKKKKKIIQKLFFFFFL